MSDKNVCISVLCGDERGGWIHPQLALFLLETVAQHPSVKLHFSLDARPVTRARNLISDWFLKSDCEWLMMIDNDVVPPLGVLEVLDSAPPEAAVIAPKCFVPVNGNPFCLGWRPIGETNVDGWQEISDCATAAVFIRRDVFARLTKPYFNFGLLPGDEVWPSIPEDLMFCRKVREAGIRIFGHRGYACSHFRTVERYSLRVPRDKVLARR